ncbi:LacI family DNA-binding transcriptional regulator [Agrobacterium sp. SHOUNA12C]|uniref:LacI family transcriptional regulator n=3 Tax=Rhizobium rhizogenes TaxID=359 RepID=A0AA87QBN0_RHIRH|nr:LacI family DNA-binding transcriptional regulator [Rhizobium rhizogenes]KAA6488839.1 LacI family DNA-binding transcriptional regulator [Agrobacterium sp. ICMP 7243]MCJ9724742.1 LacI family DNA-binding transcriptional regulator [Agrobacterium sp. BETTINA12B]MCJ9758042.1 LacI family DNA-binding transcriptional regulator [Agrobacterium sp. SHOUNA12C]OCJ01555.1 LacI family transcriptional regulator [Agrobacterium sp. 13-626]OCJ16000.1 LacI family transcriptional regulator [Agrobacterium sp. B13
MSNIRKPPTMADIARVMGVSPMTVSRAFKADSLVSAETREAILKAAEDLGYVFDSTASNFRSQKSDFVAVTIPSINNANFADTVGGLADTLAARNMQILLGYTNYDMQEEERLIEQLLRRKPQAIVVTGGKHTPRARRLLETVNIPVIETWDIPVEPIGHYVGFSNAGAVRQMVDHFVSAGHRRIAFIGGDVGRDTRGSERRAGFIAAMEAHGLDASRLIAAGVPPISMREGANAMARLIEIHPDTQAVVCVSDLAAYGALTECRRLGVPVPERFAIGGFGNYEIGEVCVPTLTTINAFAREIGEKTARLILDILDEGAAIEDVRITPELIVRDSSR